MVRWPKTRVLIRTSLERESCSARLAHIPVFIIQSAVIVNNITIHVKTTTMLVKVYHVRNHDFAEVCRPHVRQCVWS